MSGWSQQGAVRDPDHDGRLKQNRVLGISKHVAQAYTQAGGQGRVKDPSRDRRLKANRNALGEPA